MLGVGHLVIRLDGDALAWSLQAWRRVSNFGGAGVEMIITFMHIVTYTVIEIHQSSGLVRH